MAKDPHEQAEKIYHQLIDLLEELAIVYANADNEDDDGEGLDMSEVIEGIVEEAAERGLDEIATGRTFNAIRDLVKKSVGA